MNGDRASDSSDLRRSLRAAASRLRLGHFAAMRHRDDAQLPEVFIGGEGLASGPAEVLGIPAARGGGARPVGSTCTLQVALDADSSSELRLLSGSSVRHSLPVQGACPSALEDPDG